MKEEKTEAKKISEKKELPQNRYKTKKIETAVAKEGLNKEERSPQVAVSKDGAKKNPVKELWNKLSQTVNQAISKVKDASKNKIIQKEKDNEQTKSQAEVRKPAEKLLYKEIESIRKKKNKHGKRKERIFTIRGLIKAIDLPSTLEKAGLEYQDPRKINKTLLIINIIIFGIITLAMLIRAAIYGAKFPGFILFLLALWIGFFFLSLGLLWVMYLFYLDMRIYQRTKEVEKVFPDFLQLASSNISAGMPIDRALWYAVRPNFGILAKEIETVAKNTIAGQDLSSALQDFSRKYDSKVIQRSISLLLEGLSAGGELAELLNKIALNIEETRILKRDMAANVTTYVIFITFASIIAAPALLGLSTQLLEIITRITSSIATENPNASSGMMFSFSFSSDGVSVENFRIFSYVMLVISSISAAAIVNVIQKGKVKDGIYRIPIFIAVSLIIYFVSSYMMSQMFSGII
jgi:archaellum biogenesis protein FlaJ (TadC family)